MDKSDRSWGGGDGMDTTLDSEDASAGWRESDVTSQMEDSIDESDGSLGGTTDVRTDPMAGADAGSGRAAAVVETPAPLHTQQSSQRHHRR